MSTQQPETAAMDPSTKLSIHRTELALESSLMSADRTQMSVLTTSLSLIGFGFTIHKVFQEIGKAAGQTHAFGPPGRNFGLLLVTLGIGLLTAGLINRYLYTRGLIRRWQGLYGERLLLRAPPTHKISPNMVVSVLLLLGGLLVVLGIVLRSGPFG